MRDKIRSLASDTAVYGISTIVQRFLTFLLTPLYTNYLSMPELGIVSNIYALIAFVNILYSFGFDSAFMRFVNDDDRSTGSDTSNHARFVFAHAFVPIATLSAVASSVFVIFQAQLGPAAGLPPATLYLFPIIVLIPFFDALTIIPFAHLRMQRRARRFASLKLLIVVVNILLNILFVVYRREGAHGVFMAGLLSSFLGFVLMLPSIGNGLRNVRHMLSWEQLRRLAAFGMPTVPSGIASMLLQVADRPILMALTTTTIVGLYNANYRLAIPMMLLISVFEYAWKPFYLQHARDNDAPQLFSRVFTYFNLASALVFITLTLFVDVVVRIPFPGGTLINASYWQGLHIVPIVAAAYYLAGITSTLSAGLHITKHTKALPLVVGSAAIVNVALNIILIPSFSYEGAAWATLGAYLVSTVFMYVVAQRAYPLPFEYGRILRIACTAAAVMMLARYLPATPDIQGIGMRFLLLPLYMILLRFTGFFRGEELYALKTMVRQKNT